MAVPVAGAAVASATGWASVLLAVVDAALSDTTTLDVVVSVFVSASVTVSLAATGLAGSTVAPACGEYGVAEKGTLVGSAAVKLQEVSSSVKAIRMQPSHAML